MERTGGARPGWADHCIASPGALRRRAALRDLHARCPDERVRIARRSARRSNGGAVSRYLQDAGGRGGRGVLRGTGHLVALANPRRSKQRRLLAVEATPRGGGSTAAPRTRRGCAARGGGSAAAPRRSSAEEEVGGSRFKCLKRPRALGTARRTAAVVDVDVRSTLACRYTTCERARLTYTTCERARTVESANRGLRARRGADAQV